MSATQRTQASYYTDYMFYSHWTFKRNLYPQRSEEAMYAFLPDFNLLGLSPLTTIKISLYTEINVASKPFPYFSKFRALYWVILCHSWSWSRSTFLIISLGQKSHSVYLYIVLVLQSLSFILCFRSSFAEQTYHNLMYDLRILDLQFCFNFSVVEPSCLTFKNSRVCRWPTWEYW